MLIILIILAIINREVRILEIFYLIKIEMPIRVTSPTTSLTRSDKTVISTISYDKFRLYISSASTYEATEISIELIGLSVLVDAIKKTKGKTILASLSYRKQALSYLQLYVYQRRG